MDNKPTDTLPFLFYESEKGFTNVQVMVDDAEETIWVTQKSMAELFEVSKSTISEHLSNIFAGGELAKEATVRIFRTVQHEGRREVARSVAYYNLDAIIAVGYRVNSYRATQFRVWATRVLKSFMVKGFALDDARLQQGKKMFGKDYFEELLERIREIRASERRFYQKITDIYAQCSIDYDPHAPITQTFYATVQNKLHWAIHGRTAAELITERASASKPNMGLTSWKHTKKGGKILKSDVSVAKNYLQETELSELNRVVTMYLDFAENMAQRHQKMKMADWVARLDAFLAFNAYEILDNPGKVSSKVAKAVAEREFDTFRIMQDAKYESDFDKIINGIKSTGKLPAGTTTAIKPPLAKQPPHLT